MKRSIYGSEHELFRASVREFAQRHLFPNRERFIAEHGLDRAVWLAAGEQGLLGLEVPEEFGGGGAEDYRFTAILAEELGRVSAGFASSIGIHHYVVAPYLVQLTSDEQRTRWLPKFVTGEIVTALAMTEPSGGSDVAALRTTAVRSGDDWVINGSKTFITNGSSADLVLVAARTAPEKKAKGISLFAVEAGTEGFDNGRVLDKIGQMESDTAELFFKDVRVPAENLIGELDRGFIHMMERLPAERLGVALNNLGNTAQILAETIEYAKERAAFGQAIGSHQHNKFLLADLVTRLDVTTAFVDACVDARVRGELTAVDAAKAKLWTSDIQNAVIDACVQLHGGYGYMKEYRVAQAWADARVTRIWAGSNEIMKEIIGRDLGF
ncbi:acyl-CoA dehydrogenase [Pseudonocardiaceae bacterium YIM PH 21723]|nr:acyl-CoA dehydrogenase [Pseudonocardiaceae bacterium YIM PH 21723]